MVVCLSVVLGGKDLGAEAIAGHWYLYHELAPVGGRHRDGAVVVRRVAAAARDAAVAL